MKVQATGQIRSVPWSLLMFKVSIYECVSVIIRIMIIFILYVQNTYLIEIQ